jgi:hypothetical protein
LELFHASALTWEYIHKNDVYSWPQLRAQTHELDAYIRTAFPELVAAAPGIQALIRDLPLSDEALAETWPTIEWPQLVRSFDAIVAECPIQVLESMGRTADEPALAYRARRAYDALRAFVRRHDPARAEVMRIVGEQYQHGNLPLPDAARLLDMSTSDAVFELERDGFRRSPAAITLAEADRDEIYQRLRTQRLQRSGPASVDQDLIERDVIASERIEGVDARAWMRRR